MVNKVTFRVVARKDKKNKEGKVPIVVQAFINKQRVVIPLSISIPLNHFDERTELVKSVCNEAVYYNAIISDARNRAAGIMAESNIKKVKLTTELFRVKFTHAMGDLDFITFCREELERRSGEITTETYRQHKSWLSKISSFKPRLPFEELSLNTIVEFERYLIKRNNGIGTRAVALKNFKSYINHAIRYYSPKGYTIANPFMFYKVRQGQGTIHYLYIIEVKQLLKLYDSKTLSEGLKESLLIFLIECFTSLRISDLKRVDPIWINEGIINFMPRKTRRYQKVVSFPLPKVAKRLLADLFEIKAQKKLKSDQRINDDLKLLATMCGINKRVTTHVGRHTFATMYLTLKGTERGTLEVLQQILGHARIETTMRYVHVVDERKAAQIQNFDNEFQ